MPPQEVRKVLTGDPFIPFTLYVSDGASYEITSPSNAFVDLMHVTVGIDPDENDLFRRTVRIAPNHITRLEMKPGPNTRITGGRGSSVP